MKKIALMRHAKSSWKYPELTDFERPLNKRGLRDAPMMGARLAERGFRPDLIVTSPAQRAAATARKVGQALDYRPDRIREEPELYLADPDTVIAIARRLSDTVESVMFFGHNPGFTNLSNRLGDLTLDNLPTCGIVVFEFDISDWSDLDYRSGTLQLLDYPKNPAEA